MAIKLKNSREVRVVKIISVILAFLTGAFLIFSGGLFALAGFDYFSAEFSAADLASKERAERADLVYFDTSSGQNDIRNAAWALNKMVNVYRSDDYFYNTYLPERSAQIEQEYQRDMESYIQKHMEQNTPIYDDSGDDASYEYWKTAYENTSDSVEQRITYITEDYGRCQMFLRGFSVYAVNPNTGESYTNIADGDPVTVISQMPYAARYTCADRTLERKVFPWETRVYHEETTAPFTQADGSPEEEKAEPTASETLFTPVETDLDYMDLTVDFYLGVDIDALLGTTEWFDTNFFYSFTGFASRIAVTSAVAPYAAVCAVIFAVSFALALCCAGRGPLPEAGTEEYRRKVEHFGGTITGRVPVLRNVLDAIPNDLHLFLGLGLAFCSGGGFLWSYDRLNTTNYLGPFSTLVLFSLAASAFLLELCMSISRNAKAGHYWKRTVLAAMGRGWKNMGRRVKLYFSYQFKSLRTYIRRRLILYFVVMIPLSLIPVLPVFVNTFLVLSLWRAIVSLDKLMQYTREIQSGNLNVTIDTAGFPKWMVPFAQDIIHLRDGMQAAVDEALRSERLKTELITNVSHDLKTPLTSIINYTGLLAKCDIPDPQAQDYITVLQSKSDRLKHLIEDLVEASKASTGNIEFHPVRLNLYEMAVQAVGENEDALANQGVAVVINAPQEQPVVWADSQKTWRVVENLLSNVRKYSVPGTRAYIDVRTEGAFGVLTVKNISREELNISPEELMERFVRGDESRSTEGSGLGLSIAQNLCEKQGGQFTIEIDGDLFKATVRLPLAPEQSAIPESIQTPPKPAQP